MELNKKLSRIDFEVLHDIYLFRCLTIQQVYENYYLNDIKSINSFINRKLKFLIKQGLIEIVEFKLNSKALFLTTKGIDLIREVFELPTNIVDSKTKTIKRGYYRASELKMLPRLINHQAHLNQFVLEFKKMAIDKHIKWNYFDEKYVSQYVNIRPDGLIKILDTDFFLEMDMSSESKIQLNEKWRNYRNFLKSGEYKCKERRIVVLFIIEGNNIESRKDVIRVTSSEILLDILDNDFDIYIGTRDELLRLMLEKLIPNMEQTNFKAEELKNLLVNKLGFAVANGDKLKKSLHDTEYNYYIRKLTSNNSIAIEGGRIQEYLFDDYEYRPLSTLKKIAYLSRNSSLFKNSYGRDINLIVMVEDENLIYRDLLLTDLIGIKNVYFTTFKRLNEMPFYEAIFHFDNLGGMYHFNDIGLNQEIFEKRIS